MGKSWVVAFPTMGMKFPLPSGPSLPQGLGIILQATISPDTEKQDLYSTQQFQYLLSVSYLSISGFGEHA